MSEPVHVVDQRPLRSLKPPFTMYAVALCYGAADPANKEPLMVGVEIVAVSGEAPLTVDEAVARARSKCEYCWNVERFGPLCKWAFRGAALQTVTASV